MGHGIQFVVIGGFISFSSTSLYTAMMVNVCMERKSAYWVLERM